MNVSLFENAYFLKNLGWAIVNSLWQSGLIWLVYLAITRHNSKFTAHFKYYLALSFLVISFLWFAITLLLNYQTASGLGSLFQHLRPSALQKIIIYLPYLAFIYCLIFLIIAGNFISQVYKIHCLRKNGLIPVGVDLQILTNKMTLKFGINKYIQVYFSLFIEVPSVIGILKPIILLPIAMVNNLTTDQVNAVLIHEIAHIKRNDFLINILQSIIEIVLFFNPFALLLSKAIKIERENCCDDAVINFKFDKHAYAKALVILEEQRKFYQPLVMSATTNKFLLLNRIRRLFSTQNHNPKLTILQKTIISTGLILFSIIIYTLNINILLISKKEHKSKEYRFDKTYLIPAKIVGNKIVELTQKIGRPTIIAAVKTKLFSNKIVHNSSDKFTKKSINKVESPADNNSENGYDVAMINESLLNKEPKKLIAVNISDKETINNKAAFVTIKEEQSGSKRSNTYYLKLSKKNGEAVIEPLIIINKFNKNRTDSTNKVYPETKSRLILIPKRRVTT